MNNIWIYPPHTLGSGRCHAHSLCLCHANLVYSTISQHGLTIGMKRRSTTVQGRNLGKSCEYRTTCDLGRVVSHLTHLRYDRVAVYWGSLWRRNGDTGFRLRFDSLLCTLCYRFDDTRAGGRWLADTRAGIGCKDSFSRLFTLQYIFSRLRFQSRTELISLPSAEIGRLSNLACLSGRACIHVKIQSQ